MNSHQPEWLAGDFDSAMNFVAERLVISRAVGGLTKHADILSDIGGAASDVFANPHVRTGLIGAGAGAGLGALTGLFSKGRRKKLLSNVLTGALLGGAAGTGGSMINKHLLKGESPSGGGPPINPFSAEKEEAIGKATGARQELGLIGVNPRQADELIKGVREGRLSPGDARSQFKDLVPGSGEQFQSVVPAISTAFGQNRYNQMAAQADVLGLKNIIPGTGYFDPATAGLAVGGNVALRNLDATKGGLKSLGLGAEGLARSAAGKMAPGGKLHSWLQGRETARATAAAGNEVKALQKMIEEGDWKTLGLPKDDVLAVLEKGYTDPAFRGGLKPGGGLSFTRTVKGKGGRGYRFSYHAATADQLRDVLKKVKKITPPEPPSKWMSWGPTSPTAGFRSRALRGMTGGPLPALALFAPLLAREWLGGSGYRSGMPAFNDLLAANQTIGG